MIFHSSVSVPVEGLHHEISVSESTTSFSEQKKFVFDRRSRQIDNKNLFIFLEMILFRVQENFVEVLILLNNERLVFVI